MPDPTLAFRNRLDPKRIVAAKIALTYPDGTPGYVPDIDETYVTSEWEPVVRHENGTFLPLDHPSDELESPDGVSEQ